MAIRASHPPPHARIKPREGKREPMQLPGINQIKTIVQPTNRSNSSSAWGVLKHRDYRLFWLAQAVSGVGTFMQVKACWY
jgi:hypothetical protein